MTAAKKAMQLKRLAEDEAPWDEHEEAFSALSDDLEDLRGCIENNKASLECFRGDISVREVFQRVAAEIEREEAELQELEDFVNNGEERVNAIKVGCDLCFARCVRTSTSAPCACVVTDSVPLSCPICLCVLCRSRGTPSSATS